MAYAGALRDFLVAVGRGESDLEAARQKLSSFQDYNPQTIFNRINRNNDENVTADELHAFLVDNAVHTIEVAEVQVLIDFFDGDGNGKLNVEEFQHIILPCEDNDTRNAVLERNQFAKAVEADEKINIDIEHGLVAILDREVQLQRDLERLKRDLSSFVTYTSLQSYHDIERYEGKIDTVNLDEFLRANGHFATDLELLSIIRRMDADGDATVSFNEWCDFLRPNAALYKGPPVVPGYVPRSYYSSLDPLYYPSYRYRYLPPEPLPLYQPTYYRPYYYSPYYYDRYYSPYYPSYLSYRYRPSYYFGYLYP